MISCYVLYIRIADADFVNVLLFCDEGNEVLIEEPLQLKKDIYLLAYTLFHYMFSP